MSARAKKFCLSKSFLLVGGGVIVLFVGVVVFSSLSQQGNKTLSSRAAASQQPLYRAIGGAGNPCVVGTGKADSNDNLYCNENAQSLLCSAPFSFWLANPTTRDSYSQTRCATHAEIQTSAGIEGNLCRDFTDDPSKGQYRCNPGLYCVSIFTPDKGSLTQTYYDYLYSSFTDADKVVYKAYSKAVLSAAKHYTFDQDSSFAQPKGICIPQAQTKVGDCGDLNQPPCRNEAGKYICFDPNLPIIENICQPCGADNQIGCPNSEGIPAKCNDPQKFSYYNNTNSVINNGCQSLPLPEQFFDTNSLSVYPTFPSNSSFLGYSLSTNDELNIKVSGTTDQTVAASRLFTNMTPSSLRSLVSDADIDIAIFQNRDIYYSAVNYLTPASTTTLTCNDTQIVLPEILWQNLYSQFTQYRDNLTPEQEAMGAKAWNDCKFHFGTNIIKIQKVHMVFNNGGTDIVYDYDFTKASQYEVSWTFTYTKILDPNRK